MKKVLVIIDMQNDFITGSLKNPDAEAIVPKICKYLEDNSTNVDVSTFDNIVLTKDTHYSNYLKTSEGKNLPVEHCLYETEGNAVHKDIIDTLYKTDYIGRTAVVVKQTFGFLNWNELMEKMGITQNEEVKVTLVGTCTDICVISNALILKAVFPDYEIEVIEGLCAGTTPENHMAAIKVMESCQVEINNSVIE